MGKGKKKFQGKPGIPQPKIVNSLLEVMKDGSEYESIIPYLPQNGNVLPEIKKAIAEVENIRRRPCICYVANVIKPISNTSIELSDDLPFNEMLSKISSSEKEVDVFVVTGGGSGQQISQFVSSLRSKFEGINFLLPYMCMSAGTLWALSGDSIWMDQRAFIGPIDPQVRATDGSLVPAQAILVLLNKIKEEGEAALKTGANPPWHYIRLIDTMDRRQIGDAISLSNYSTKLATKFLNDYKFKSWITHKDGRSVTIEEREDRAKWVAEKLCSNDYWKSHAHGISREAANIELKLKIDPIESVDGLERAVRRLWALFYYAFDKSAICKMFISKDYTLVRSANVKV